jgi:hypothetical protein
VDDIDKLLPAPSLDDEDIRDLAHDFIEQEIGRHDWKNNWVKAKATTPIEVRIERWLRRNGDHDGAVQPIILYIDGMVKRYGSSKWR